MSTSHTVGREQMNKGLLATITGYNGKLMDNDWVVFRYADALLMKAEALLRTGKADEALALVNEVRSRSGAESRLLVSDLPWLGPAKPVNP